MIQALRLGALGGLAGGAVEVAWVALYAALTETPAAPVARGVVEAVVPAWAASSHGVALGILIHLGLAIALGISLAFALRLFGTRSRGAPPVFAWVTGALLMVWAVNFFLVLPHMSPKFVHLLPYGATMLSKLLFGISAAVVFRAKRDYWVGSAAARRA
jgi:hypothetical protein